MEDDAALMAELLAISNKSASSRFDGGGGDTDPQPQSSPPATPRRKFNAKPNSKSSTPMSSKSTSSPSKRRGRLASAKKAEDIMNSMKKVISSDELMNHSFEDQQEPLGDNIQIVSRTPPQTPDHRPKSRRSRSRSNSRSRSRSRSRSMSRSRNNSFHTETAAESTSGDDDEPSSGFGFNNSGGGGSGFQSSSSNFSGERGGAAEDADLLAELRAISNKNKSTDRFAGGADDYAPKTQTQTQTHSPIKSKTSSPKKTLSSSKKTERSPPPWKRKGKAKAAAATATTNANANDPMDNFEMESKSKPKSSKPVPREEFGFADKTSQSTFQGERGGAAEDDDLLAELRAISMKNGSADRFQNYDASDPMSPPPAQMDVDDKSKEKPWQKKKASKKDGDSLPPWKRKGAAKKKADPFGNAMVDDAPSMSQNSFDNFADKAPPKTFQGDRGGAAEDDDLLAELRAISMKNGSADRFQGGDEGGGALPPPPKPASQKSKSPARRKPAPKKDGDSLPPWKRKGAAKKKADPFGNAMVDDAPSMSQNSFDNFADKAPPKTFQGDRGGAAEDDDLLAELRAISMKNGSADRFQGGDEGGGALPPPPKSSPRRKQSPAPKRKTSPAKTFSGPSTFSDQKASTITIDLPNQSDRPVIEIDDDNTITAENVSEMISSKNWKLRKASYDVLSILITNKTKGRSPANDLDDDDFHACIKSSLAQMAKDSNASALDSALRVIFLYIDYCKGGCDPDQIAPLASSIVTGPALNATRPSTAKLVESVLMKIMEVSRGDPSSIHIVVDNLLESGLSSKKPKVVIKSVNMILDAGRAFGAATLPLSKITSSASKMLSHINGSVRDSGINILAEICRAVGSKDPLSDVIESMKKAQVSELDALLSGQSDSFPPTIGLRYSTTSSASASNALEELHAGAAEDAAARFAAREPVNIFDALKRTDYRTKLKEAKWSEKTGALDILMKCGGETPYKLVQPSSSANYNSLISEIKQLLSHSHFAVRSKAMLSLGMLAEGVGEKLFSNLKPLLLVLLGLMKDKKVTRATNTCLDQFFGNVVGFTHLLDKEDGLHVILNEKKEKSVLVRQSSLAFVGRCINRSEQAGNRGGLDEHLTERIVELCITKLSDSDTNVRKESMTVIKTLLGHHDELIVLEATRCSKGLEQSNPRAYKAIYSSSANGNSRPPLTGASPRSPSRSKKLSSPSASPKRRSNSQGSRPRSNNLSDDSQKKNGVPKKRRSNLPSSFQKSKKSPQRKKKSSSSKKASSSSDDEDFSVVINDNAAPAAETAVDYIAALDIPKWNIDEEDGGILSGIQSSNWKFRKIAIEGLIDYCKTTSVNGTDVANVLAFVKSHTKQFKDSNFNILKTAAELFIGVCNAYENLQIPMEIWMCRDAASIAVSKIADKKFSSVSPLLLSRLCEIQLPEVVLYLSISIIEPIKSPVPHEGLLIWCDRFCKEFGAKAIGKCMKRFVGWVSKVSLRSLHGILDVLWCWDLTYCISRNAVVPM